MKDQKSSAPFFDALGSSLATELLTVLEVGRERFSAIFRCYLNSLLFRCGRGEKLRVDDVESGQNLCCIYTELLQTRAKPS